MDMLEEEARLFSLYLVGRQASPQVIRLYKAAMGDSEPENTDKKLLNFMVLHPRSIGFIDAGLALRNSSSEARRRLYVMLAILEANVEYYNLFLPKKRGPFYILVIFYSGARAVVKAGLGFFLVKAVT